MHWLVETQGFCRVHLTQILIIFAMKGVVCMKKEFFNKVLKVIFSYSLLTTINNSLQANAPKGNLWRCLGMLTTTCLNII